MYERDEQRYRFRWESMAIAIAFLTLCMASPALAGSKFQANLITPPVTLDAGVDSDGDLANDIVAIPACTGSPDQQLKFCVKGASSSETCDTDADCPPSLTEVGRCAAFGAPDGITTGDMPALTLVHGGVNGKKSKCQVKKTKLQCKVAFNNDFQTSPSGVCRGGIVCENGFCAKGNNKNEPCSRPEDCGCEKSNDCKYGYCKSIPVEDEYVCQIDLIANSNADNNPPCDPNACVAYASLDGGVNFIGVAGTCVGGDRDGLTCSPLDAASCPNGGTCSCTPGAYAATGDEILFDGSLSGVGPVTLMAACPGKFRLDYPFDVKKGKGKVKVDLTDPPLNAVIPQTTQVQVEQCAVHEPGTHNVGWIGLYATPSDPSDDVVCQKTPCPDTWVPLQESLTGLNVNAAHGPIIAITGLQAPKDP